MVYDNSAYGSGTGEILSLSSVTNCVGNEVNIFDCRMFISDDSTCSDHTNDVGLSCHNASLGMRAYLSLSIPYTKHLDDI